MMRLQPPVQPTSVLLLACLLAGCATTSVTDSPRTASEMQLVSQAIDSAVDKIDFTFLAGETVYLDTSALGKDAPDMGYLISATRQQMLAHGALLQDERSRAVYVVEMRSGALGTDRFSVTYGLPSLTLASLSEASSVSTPDIALGKKSYQSGVAKVGVFAYNRLTGRGVWQSGAVAARSQLKDTWALRAGPFRQSTFLKRSELCGEPVPKLTNHNAVEQ